MPDLIRELEEAWTYVATSAPTSEEIPSRPISVQASSGPVRVAIDGDDVRHLLIPVGKTGDIVSDRQSRGVVIVPQNLVLDSGRQLFADMVCVDARLADVFTRLAAAVCESISEEPHKAGSAPAGVLDEWRELLSKRAKVMGREAATGLFGELAVLLTAVQATGPTVFKCWLGHEGHQHDFAGSGQAVEVKTTTAREGRRVEIHGIEQLSSGPETDLYLAFVRLLADPDGETIAEVAQRLVDAGIPYLALERRMAKVGYSGEEHDDLRFRISLVEVFEVGSKFPAITNESFSHGLPSGVESVRYVCDVAAAGSPLSTTEVDTLFASMVGA